MSTRNFSKFQTTSLILNFDQKLSRGENVASSGRRQRSYEREKNIEKKKSFRFDKYMY